MKKQNDQPKRARVLIPPKVTVQFEYRTLKEVFDQLFEYLAGIEKEDSEAYINLVDEMRSIPWIPAFVREYYVFGHINYEQFELLTLEGEIQL